MIESAIENMKARNEIESIRHAQLCTIIINMHISSKEIPAKIEDFLPKEMVEKMHPKMTAKEQARIISERGRRLAARCKER